MIKVFDKYGSPKVLGNLIARGGEGSVYLLPEKQGVLVKIYHQEKLETNNHEYQTKIDAMIGVQEQFKDIDVCWPLLSVYDSSRQWIGYAMKQGFGKPMRLLAHAVAYKKDFPNLNRVILVRFLLNFLKTIEALHSREVYIGDYNMLNFLCDNTNNKVTLIDCDSYQITIGNKQYPCPVGSPDMTPVEHQNMDFKRVTRTKESEAFSLAIIIFECLMLGRHPYDVVDGDDPVTNLRNAHFPYGKGNSGIPVGPWYNIWSHMPHKLKALFIQTFTSGVTDLNLRPSVPMWHKELSVYLQEMDKNWHNKEIKPLQPKSSVYRGNRQLNPREVCHA
jgi:DNA-binding helix-hairpin-helix protein with protein kinase domain